MKLIPLILLANMLLMTHVTHPANAQLCIAHRGDSANHPENSIEAIESAWQAGADMVEVDVRMVADDVLVLFHDAKVEGVKISSVSHEQLISLTGAKVPRLQASLRAGKAGKALLLDLKEESDAFIGKLVDLLSETDVSPGEVILQSPSLSVLEGLRARLGDRFELFYLTSLERTGFANMPPDAVELARKLKALNVNGVTAKGRKFVDRSFVEAFQSKGIRYFVWTINPPDRIRHYASLRVDGIITDDPALMVRLLAK